MTPQAGTGTPNQIETQGDQGAASPARCEGYREPHRLTAPRTGRRAVQQAERLPNRQRGSPVDRQVPQQAGHWEHPLWNIQADRATDAQVKGGEVGWGGYWGRWQIPW